MRLPGSTDPIVAFATSATVADVTDDDRLLARELEAAGMRVEPAVWDSPALEWKRYAAVVVRSTWDYHLRHDVFMAWVGHLEHIGVPVLNPPRLMRWNADKHYLMDLAAHGVPVVPTRWVRQHDAASLAQIMEEAHWEHVVVKPAVSASAHRTWRASVSEAPLLEENFRALVATGSALVQPFVEAVTTDGEWSLLFYGGTYSHSVLKRPRHDDFRVQREHGGTSAPSEPSLDVVDDARLALRTAERARGVSLYARVDGCVLDGRFVVMELELIEPDRFLRSHPEAPGRLARSLLSMLHRG